jgi:hypothetical protein
VGRLFEIIAVEGDAQSRAVKLIQETKTVFSNKENLFKGKQRTLQLFDRPSEKLVEIEALEAKDTTYIKVESTVPDSLNYLGCILADYWDLMYQKEASNQVAKADIVMDGNVLLANVPLTFLLCMESRLRDLRVVFDSIPTLSPGIEWTPDTAYGKHIYQSPLVKNVKTREDTEYRVVVQATDKFPAQVQAIKGQFNIGQYSDKDWSGLISSAEKANLLLTFDKLIAAVKTARQRANDTDANKDKVGDILLTALIGPWFNRSLMNPVK